MTGPEEQTTTVDGYVVPLDGVVLTRRGEAAVSAQQEVID